MESAAEPQSTLCDIMLHHVPLRQVDFLPDLLPANTIWQELWRQLLSLYL
ncbi:hypothetical protein [Endozoicomonas lisbonensis]|uniref:Uncharacterized protein n=1 Tax=Endozoicomonas lisbonensis TaxID=3120522 RepID=A0ABV2SH00_9GAMM